MAEYKGKQGRWITTKDGRHLFLEDEVDKQEREIKESKARQDALNAEHEVKSDPVKDNAYFRGLAEDAKKVLAMPEDDFEKMGDKQTALYEELGKFAKYGVDKGETYEALKKAHHRLEAVVNMAYVNTGRYEDEAKKYGDKKLAESKSKEDLVNRVKRLKKEHPNDYVSSFGTVMESVKRNGKSTDAFVGEYKKAFDKAGVVYLIDGRAESLDNPAGIIGTYKTWDGAKPQMPGNFSWGWFTDKDGKKKLWFYEPD